MALENGQIVATQVLILFLWIAVGVLTRRLRLLGEDGIRQITNLLLIIVMPAVMINAFQIPFQASLITELAIVAAVAFFTHILGAVIARLVYRRQPDDRRSVLSYNVIFANCSFMSLPLLQALLGDIGIFYGSVFIAVFNIFQWTYGVILMRPSRGKLELRHAFVNPGTVSLLVALLFFVTGLKLPMVPATVVAGIAGMNSPLAMIVTGAQFGLSAGRAWRDRGVVLAAALRLLVIPAAAIALMVLLDLPRVLAVACLIPSGAPTGVSSTLFANRYHRDVRLSNQSVLLTTLLSILTVPLLILILDLWMA